MKAKYKNFDGIRAYAAIFIVLMHVRANGKFDISGFVYNRMIPSFTNLTFFFMLLSAFSMCCGYYDRFRNNTMDIEQFYRRRINRIWPYFTFLCTAELILDRSMPSLYEWFADITLSFGLLPNANISVVGVGWFIGIVFVFYMLFPFFTYLIGNKRRAWIVLCITIIFNFLCSTYFFDQSHVVSNFTDRANIIYSSMFFVAGGLIYLYREIIERIQKRWIIGILIIIVIIFYYTIDSSVYTLMLVFSSMTIMSICSDTKVAQIIFCNDCASYLGSISMEIFLSHMFVFRLIEKCRLLHITGNEIINYTFACIVTICGTVIMAVVINKCIAILSKVVNKWRFAK